MADLGGPYTPSIYGEKYCLVIVDVYTQYLEVFPLPSKKEVASKGNYKVKTFRTDNGTEFHQGLTTYFGQKSIAHQTTG